MKEKFLKLPEYMKFMKRMIPEKPVNTKISLRSISRTTGNNVLPTPQKNSITQRILYHPFFLLIQVLIKLRMHLGNMTN